MSVSGINRWHSAAAVLLATSWSAWADDPKWAPSIDLEAKPGSSRHLGEIDVFVPLLQDTTTLMFGNVRGRLDDEDNREGNFGLGVRHMLQNGWNLGGYGYFDRRRTENDNHFSQVTFGLEALGTDFDLRANGYLPLGSRVRGVGVGGGGPPSAAVVGSSIQVTTPGYTALEERSLKGFDGEIGFRIPIWMPDADQQFRFYVGGYHFSGDDVETVAGPRVRAELTMSRVPGMWDGSRLTFGAEYQHDDVRGSQGSGLIRLRLPLQFFGTEHPSLPTAQERRMTEPVKRDVDVVAGSAKGATSPTVVETATRTANGQVVTVINGASVTGAQLPGAIAALGANSFALMAGTFDTTATTNLQNGQTMMGAGALSVVTPTGKVAVLNAPGATINGNVPGTGVGVVALAANSTLIGMTISNRTTSTGATGVYGVNANGTRVLNNAIMATSTSFSEVSGLRLDFTTNFTVSGNSIATQTANSNSGGLVLLSTGAGTITGNALTAVGPQSRALFFLGNNGAHTVAENTFNASGGGTFNQAAEMTNVTINPNSVGNVLVSGTCNTPSGVIGSIQFTNGSSCPP